MRTLLDESPPFLLFRTILQPHKGAACQGGDELIARTKASRSQFRCGNRVECFEFDRRIGSCVHLGSLHIRVTEPERDFSQILRCFKYIEGTAVPAMSLET
jgi:hypothetical protein